MPDPRADPAGWARRTADLLVRTASGLGAAGFDFSEASIVRLDDFADRLWDPAIPPSADELESLTKLMGSYLGEVLVRQQYAHWTWLEDRQMPALQLRSGTIAFVYDKAYKRQVNGREADSLLAFYDGAKLRAGG